MRKDRRQASSVGIAALVALLLIPGGADAQAQWKWRDARGQIQYSDIPPPTGIPERDILQRPPETSTARSGARPGQAASAAAPASASGPKPPQPPAESSDPALAARRKELEQQAAAKRKAEEAQVAQQKAENCESAQTYLRSLDSGQRLARVNAQGEREYLDEAARAQQSAKARQAIETNCR